jgi:flagellum-specific peptidoglycan hydrolase FlgJ
VPPAPRPQWQQATALITIGAGGIATGLSFVPKAAADLTTPASIPPVTLLALEHANAPAPGRDAMLRAAIVHMARHFLRLADTRSPAEMEAMIWQYASTDGANHGPSCGAFASLTLELGSHIAGVDSWVAGGTSYPWPVHSWVDGRVDPNPASPGVVSILQDARNHGRWHPARDGYTPQPGDWVLFDGHVEVVTKYHGGVLHTIGGDSLPDLSVNAHEYADPLREQGVAGFVDNGIGMSKAPGGAAHTGGGKHGGRATSSPGRPGAAQPMASAAPSPSGGPASPAGPASVADPMPGGAAASGRARGGAASGGAASNGQARGGSASGGAAFDGPSSNGAPSAGAAAGGAASGGGAGSGGTSSAGPVTTAAATAQQPEFAPRAIPVPPTVRRFRYAQESRALPEQGAGPALPTEHASGRGTAARTARAARAVAESRQQNRTRTGKQASASDRAPRPADQRPQHADHSPQSPARSPQHGDRSPHHADRHRAMTADVPATGLRPARPHHARPGQAAIPGLFKGAHRHHPGDGAALAPYHRHDVPPVEAPVPGTATQQAFIKEVADGAMATQRKYGVPASVTIAQAIDESGWGQSLLATNDHNLFGIKGTGPAGSDEQPTQEVINGQLVNLSASFQIYQDIAQSIDAHGRLLAHSGNYAGAMTQSKDPNAFAAALTGIYATDPSYGAKLIQLMKQYDLYRFDHAASHGDGSGAGGGAPATRHHAHAARRPGAHPGGEQHPARRPLPSASPDPRRPSPGRDHKPNPRQPGPIGNPVPVQPAPIAEPVPGQPAPIANPVPIEPGQRSPAHDANAARGTKPGASVAAHEAAGPRAGQATDRIAAVHHDAVTPPTAVLYPGRSARPAPLAHPARPADLARPASPAPSADRGATSTPMQPQLPGLWPDPAPAASRSSAGSANGRQAGQSSPGSATRANAETGANSATGPRSGSGAGSATGQGSGAGPGSGTGLAAWPGSGTGSTAGTGPGQANISAGAAIPGVPHAVTAHASRTHAGRPSGHLRPAHAAGRPTRPASRAQHTGPTAPGIAVGANADARGATAPTVQPASSSPDVAHTPHVTVPTASAPMVSQAGSTMIPGLQHHGLGPHVAAGLSSGASSADGAQMAAAKPGGSSIPGAEQGVVAGSASQAALPGTAAAGPLPGAANPVPEPANPAPAPANLAPEPANPAPAPANLAPEPANPVAEPANPVPAAANPLPTPARSPARGGADVPGLVHTAPTVPADPTADVSGGSAGGAPTPGSSSHAPGGSPASTPAQSIGATLTVYHAHMPLSVRQAFITSAKMPLVRSEHLYRDVASHTGIRWEILAACDWMQCKARHGYSPVYGEKLGALNPDDTCYRTKSAALEQCASDLVQLAGSVYQLDIATSHELSVRDLANVFAAFRWGGLLRQHCTSAMDFPYSVAGLTADHTHMRWPNIDEPNAPDKPGSRFRQQFGAVPVVLSLNYQALI